MDHPGIRHHCFLQRIVSKISALRKIPWPHTFQQLFHDRDFSNAGPLRAMVMGSIGRGGDFRLSDLDRSTLRIDAIEKMKRIAVTVDLL